MIDRDTYNMFFIEEKLISDGLFDCNTAVIYSYVCNKTYDNKSYRTIEEIAYGTNTSIMTVRRSLRKLEEIGFIQLKGNTLNRYIEVCRNYLSN